MRKIKNCSVCQCSEKQYKLLSTYKFGPLCAICYAHKHFETAQKGLEERLARQAQRKLDAENEAFNIFLETGIVTIQKKDTKL